MKPVLFACTLIMATSAAFAQSVPSVGANAGVAGSGGASPVQKLLAEGFEVKTGFSDNSGGAYIVLQKATSAFMCHSSPVQTCEKLN